MTVTTIKPQDFAGLCKDGKKIDLIDVRTPVEYREVHVGIARNVPLDRHDVAAQMQGRNGSATEPLYVICRSGSRGQQACDISADLFIEARDCLESVLTAETEDGKRKQLGRFLKKNRDRVVGAHRVRAAVDGDGNETTDHAGRPRYRLELVTPTTSPATSLLGNLGVSTLPD